MLNLENIEVKYNQVIACTEINLKVKKNDIVTVVGSNGAGKSSLIKAIFGINKVKKGKIIFEDQEITNLDSHKICKLGIGQVAEGRQIFSGLTVLENLKLGSFVMNFNNKAIEDNLENVFFIFPKLKERLQQVAGSMSGGEQQMLAIGRCLMAKPKLILLDEPSLGLAPIIVKNMFKLIKQLNESGMTILLVEQNVRTSLTISNYCYVLENGRITLEGDNQSMQDSEKIKKAYLGI